MRGDEMAPFTSWIFAQPLATLVLQHKLFWRRHVTSKIRNVKLWVYRLTVGQWFRSNISSDRTASVQEPSKPAEKNLINLVTNISNNLCSIFQCVVFCPWPFIFPDHEEIEEDPFWVYKVNVHAQVLTGVPSTTTPYSSTTLRCLNCPIIAASRRNFERSCGEWLFLSIFTAACTAPIAVCWRKKRRVQKYCECLEI